MSKDAVMKFIRAEVVRQGFENESPEFWFRVGAMASAWNHARTHARADVDALKASGELHKLVEHWGMMVEPMTNYTGFRTCGVYVGGRLCPAPELVPGLMAEWSRSLEGKTADDIYVAFQKIHPFRDGNGRTGKILHNWLLGSLDEPVLIEDYFGMGLP